MWEAAGRSKLIRGLYFFQSRLLTCQVPFPYLPKLKTGAKLKQGGAGGKRKEGGKNMCVCAAPNTKGGEVDGFPKRFF